MDTSTEPIDEDRDRTPDELLDWLCWMWALDGERFFPPDETAEECMVAVAETYEGQSDEDRIKAKGWEHGQHARAWTEAVERFHDLEARGFDPKARAEREIARAREDGLDLQDIDWEWWDSQQ